MESLRETLLCHYCYDALDRLIANELPSTPGRQRFYCKSRLATEIQGAMRISIVQHGDQLLAQQKSEGDGLDTILVTTDQQRSVLQALKVNQPPAPIAYSPYGHRSAENGLLSLLGFNGERPDPVTGCYLLGNGYRAFNPVLMRFNSPDSLSPFGRGGVNLYAYCLGNPTNSNDPSGHIPLFGSSKHHRQMTLMNKSVQLLGTNSAENLKLRDAAFREILSTAKSSDNMLNFQPSPPPGFPHGPITLQRLAANKLTNDQIKILPPRITIKEQPLPYNNMREQQRLLPLYEGIAIKPPFVETIEYNYMKLDRMAAGKLSLPTGINPYDAIELRNQLESITNPNHQQNMALISANIRKSSQLHH